MGVRPPIHKGIPALAGYRSNLYGVLREDSYCRVGSFPKPGRLIGRFIGLGFDPSFFFRLGWSGVLFFEVNYMYILQDAIYYY